MLPYRRRIFISLCVSLALGLVVRVYLTYELQSFDDLTRWLIVSAASFDGFAMAYVFLPSVHSVDPDGMNLREVAQEAYLDERSLGWLTVLSVLAGACGGALIVDADRQSEYSIWLISIGAVTLASAWWTFQQVHAHHYARLYYFYSGITDAPLRFPEDEPPGHSWHDDSDFIYLAVAIGTTFGTTDVQLCSPEVRKIAARQGVVAFFFNALIIASALFYFSRS